VFTLGTRASRPRDRTHRLARWRLDDGL